MTSFQPVLALALAVLSGLLSQFPPGEKRFNLPNLLSTIGYIAVLCAGGYCSVRLGHVDDHRAVFASIAAGGIVSILAACLTKFSNGVPIGLAIAGACAAHLVRADNFPEVGLAFAFSVSLGAIFFAPRSGPVLAALIGAAVTMADYLGKDFDHDIKWSYVGIALGIGIAAAAAVLLGAKRVIPKALGRLESGLAMLLGAAAGYWVSRWMSAGDLWILVGLAAVAALVVHWLVPVEGDTTPMRTCIGAAIWLSLTTVGFSMEKGFGMAVCLLEGIGVLAIIGNQKALLTTGPALGLLMYRVLRDASPDTSRALDIAQHYGVTGIAIGTVIPVLYADWFEKHRNDKAVQDALSSLLWSFVLICLPVLTIVVLGAKGASGLVVGLGMSGLLLAARKYGSAAPLAVALAAGAANAVAVDWIGDAMNATRHEKLHSFGLWLLAMTVAAVGILAVSKRRVSAEAAS